MRQSFKYPKDVIEKAMLKYGIKSLDLRDKSNVYDTVSNILHFLDLSKDFEVNDTNGHDDHGYVRFTLTGSAEVSKEKFLNGIAKFQEHLDPVQVERKVKLGAIELIKEIENFISHNPDPKYEIFFGQTTLSEQNIKVKLGLPEYWYFVQLSEDVDENSIGEYLKQINIRRDGRRIGNNIYLFGKEKVLSPHDKESYLGCSYTVLPLMILLIMIFKTLFNIL